MTKQCIICKKELQDSTKLPLCEYHKSMAGEKAKDAGKVVVSTAAFVGLLAKDKIGPIVLEKAAPIAKEVLKVVIRR